MDISPLKYFYMHHFLTKYTAKYYHCFLHRHFFGGERGTVFFCHPELQERKLYSGYFVLFYYGLINM